MSNLNKEIWEGRTVLDFIASINDEIFMIMSGRAIIKPFKTREEMKKHINECKPCYKKDIPELDEYFYKMYNL